MDPRRVEIEHGRSWIGWHLLQRAVWPVLVLVPGALGQHRVRCCRLTMRTRSVEEQQVEAMH